MTTSTLERTSNLTASVTIFATQGGNPRPWPFFSPDPDQGQAPDQFTDEPSALPEEGSDDPDSDPSTSPGNNPESE
jgi:hypothetical protein